ncbi:cation-translocating P-type ATPase [Bacteroidota bacterium]
MEFYNQESKDVLKELDVKLENGLTEAEAEARRKEKGPNELKSKKRTSPIILFLNQFRSFIIYILLFAVVISLISGEYIDSIVILIILFFNAIFGFIQEYKADKAIHALRRMASLKATVIRHGKKQLIDARELVIGDIILLEEGNKVPADSRIIEETELKISEASLTGESVSVSKASHPLEGKLVIQDRKNMVFSGTMVTMGRATAVVTATGMDTEIGKIAEMITEMEPEMTPLQKKLETLGRKIAFITITICIIIFFVGILKENLVYVLTSQGFFEFLLEAKTWLMTAVSLAVAAVPEGLPAIVTIALAIGVRKMVKRNALIRHLPSVETLGEATVICSDKTGTITRNQMTVEKAYTNLLQVDITGDGYEFEGTVTVSGKPITKNSKLVFKIGALCNNASLDFEGEGKKEIVTGDPTEIALLVSAEKAGLGVKNLEKNWKRIKEKPFDSIRKMMTTINVDPNSKEEFVFTKGAVEEVLKKCDRIIINGVIRNITSQDKQHILAKNEEYAKGALRVLGFAYKKYSEREAMEKNLVFVGLQGMIDPPHSEVKDAIVKCKEAGIRVIMITGDNKHTAEAIAREVGIEGESMNGLEFEKLPDGDKSHPFLQG